MNSLPYYKNLDALRALAAFGVIFAHYFSEHRFPEYAALTKIATLGNTGVSLFFVLSGFVITRILLQTWNTPRYFSSFYIRRSLRIFPLYYLGLLVYIIAAFLMQEGSGHVFQSNHLYYVFYLQNVARTFSWETEGPPHYWSLAVEEHFYLLWPAVVYFCMKFGQKTLFWTSFILIVITHALRYFMFRQGYPIDVFTFTRLDQLVLGGVLALYEANGSLRSNNSWKYVLMMVAGALGVGALEVQSCAYTKEVFQHTALGVLFAGMLLYAVTSEKKPIWQTLFQNSTVQFLGKVSYGLYVWHVLCLYLYDHYFPVTKYFGFFFVLFFTIFVSWLSFRFFEEPFLKLKSKFNYAAHD